MIIVFGSLNVDMVFHTETMPKPGDTLLCPGYKLYAGGKGANQAVAAARMGAKVHMVGCLGKDTFATFCRDSLKEAGVNVENISTGDKVTGCAMICVDEKGENMITVASGANLLAQSDLISDSLLSNASTLILQMEVPSEENWKLVKRASEKGIRIILNLAPAKVIPEEILLTLSILVINEVEATLLALNLGFEVNSPTLIAQEISTLYGITCVITLGEKGVFASSPLGTWTVPALPITPLDTTAAGDAFVGTLAAKIDEGLNLEDSLKYASVAGGLACTIAGAQPSLPNSQEVENALSLLPTSLYSSRASNSH
jgi:ribokinase